MMSNWKGSWHASAAGFTVLEIVFVLSATATATAIVVPVVGNAVDEMRTAMAARYVAGRVRAARMDAVRRSRAVALRFEPGAEAGEDYTFTVIGDGNGNGIRTAEVRDGIDVPLAGGEQLAQRYPGVNFALAPDAPDADGRENTGIDGVRIGSAQILTMSSDGTATSGTLYIRGRRGQYAVRVLGATGRTRVLQYHPGLRTWIDR